LHFNQYDWFEDAVQAKERASKLLRDFDTFFPLRHYPLCEKTLLRINTELEVLEHFFDWLQID
jgi:hypothetical protein